MPDIAENLRQIRERMAAACARVKRDISEVTLVAVTKTVGPDEIRELYRLGIRDFGENRVADGTAHLQTLAQPDARWHLIGHLQRNKASAVLAGGFHRIHSVESIKLLDVLERDCDNLGIEAEILIEVNISGEDAKYGVSPDNVDALAEAALAKKRLRLSGLMTMAPFTDDPETARPVFHGLRECRNRLREKFGAVLPHLSMGMTGDFEVAIEEGATMVRVGTALFL